MLIERDVIANAMQSIVGVFQKASTLPILGCVHIQGDGNTLCFTGTDLQTTLKSWVQCEHEPINVVTPGRKLYDVVKSFPDGSVLDIKPNDSEKLIVKCKRSRFTLELMNPDDYPINAQDEQGTELNLKSSTLLDLLCGVEYAAARKDVRYYLNGIAVEINGLAFDVVASDGHRLAKLSHILEHTLQDKISIVIPIDSVAELMKVLKTDPECRFVICKRKISVYCGDKLFSTQLLECKYIEYERVIPKAFDVSVQVSRKELIELCQRSLLVFDKGMLYGIHVSINEGLLHVVAKGNSNEIDETLNIEYHGEACDFGINVNYMLDTLRSIQSDTVSIQFNKTTTASSTGPITLCGVENDDGIHILMTMRI